MDRGQDTSLLPLTAADTPVAPAEPAASPEPIRCDQAVYSSVRSPAGSGYRILSSSDGIIDEEMSEIIRRTPSVGGLCPDTPDAVGVSFFGLQSGRYATLRTCHLGREPSGRGDRRTYTHIFVTGGAELGRLGNNPFGLLRGLASDGVLEPELTPPRPLPALEVRTPPLTELPAGAPDASQPAPRWVTGMICRLMAGESVVLAAPNDLFETAERLISALPAPQRPAISFSVNVPLSASRAYRLVVVPSDRSVARQCEDNGHYHFQDLSTHKV